MKYKKIPKDDIKICIDRLTRFKPVYEKYTRVFKSILNKYLISSPKFSENDFDEALETVVSIFNDSIPFEYDPFISEILFKEEEEVFYLDDFQKKLLSAKLNLTGAVKMLSDDEDLPPNLKRLKFLEQNRAVEKSTLKELFPVKKVILTEGATEEILLPEFAKKLGFNFKENGIYVLGAGGKNQVARKYYKMCEEVKIPVFILLDSDAKETRELILPKLKAKDKIHIIPNGEFEDILPLDLIIGAINSNFKNDLHCAKEDFNPDLKMIVNLHDIFKNKGFGEYKKAEFAKIVKNYLLNSKGQVSVEIQNIIEEIKNI